MNIRITEDYIGKRFDVAISQLSNGLSRSMIQKLMKRGCVTIEECPLADPSKKVMGQCDVYVDDTSCDDDQYEIEAEDIALEVLYEDEHLVVINKPAGLVCHPAPGHKSGTLVNAIAFRFNNELSDIGGPTRPGIVHRLDMNTSGVMLIAKNNDAHNRIATLFANGKGDLISRNYACFVFGRPGQRSGCIDTLIKRHPRLRQQYTVGKDRGKRALTIYELDQTVYCSPTSIISKMMCKLLTGRTHQIRVHMKHIGLPVIGDQVYGKSKVDSTYPDVVRNLKRQALHAMELSFVHPFTKERMTFNSQLPPDLKMIDELFSPQKPPPQ
ncbi:MAG: RluA family pseudouridine synthase [Holosporales bacterium]|jgi:23S rRNA pseudouridine1911/1915/1917 synthase|nr:RluA family pseudouridine synthase [Holosporales bacterium]